MLKSLNNIYFSNFIFYDSLIGLNLLNFSNKYSNKLLIGKRFNQYSILKKTIYLLIFISYKKYRFISKLKSGDINFFSRINNEINFFKNNYINYIIVPGITTFVTVFSNLNWFFTKRFNISSILFVTYFNNNSLLKINKNFLNKTIIYYMINNNFYYIFEFFNKNIINNFYFCFVENFNYISEHIYVFNFFDFIFYINKNFLKYNFPKLLIFGKIYNYFNINLFINFL